MAYDFRNSPTVDQVGIEERVARFNTRSIKKGSKVQALKLALNMIDLTTLEGKDTEGKVKQMCYKAMPVSYTHLDVYKRQVTRRIMVSFSLWAMYFLNTEARLLCSSLIWWAMSSPKREAEKSLI